MKPSRTVQSNLETIEEFLPNISQIIGIVQRNYNNRPNFAIVDLHDNTYGLSIVNKISTRENLEIEENHTTRWSRLRAVLSQFLCWCRIIK